MQSMSVMALRSAARRAAVSCSRRGLAATATAAADAAEKEKLAAMVQQEVRSQLRAEGEARAKAERESVAALVQRTVRDLLREEEELRAEGELRAYWRRREEEAGESGPGLWASLDSWQKGFWVGYASCLAGGAYVHLLIWIAKP